uniref:Uncharacterized protein n=1 Tax=Rhizophora mucronata TaxID=61149 RepID=A0A2P2JSA7_RHIMU
MHFVGDLAIIMEHFA